jgi:hypothetical protein
MAICCKKFKVHLKIPVAANVKKKKTSAVFLHVNTFITVPDPGGATFSLSQSRATDPLEKSTRTVYRRYFFLHCFAAFYIIHMAFGPPLLLLLLSASVWHFNNVAFLDHFLWQTCLHIFASFHPFLHRLQRLFIVRSAKICRCCMLGSKFCT